MTCTDKEAAFHDLEFVVSLQTDTEIPRNGDFLMLTPPTVLNYISGWHTAIMRLIDGCAGLVRQAAFKQEAVILLARTQLKMG